MVGGGGACDSSAPPPANRVIKESNALFCRVKDDKLVEEALALE